MLSKSVLGLALTGVLLVPMPASPQGTVHQITADVVYGHKDGMALTFDVFQPAANANGAGILYIVSAGWESRWQPPELFVRNFEALLAMGFTVFAVRHGSRPRYKVPDAAADVELAARHIRFNASKFGVDPTRLGAFGRSAGGQLALMLALDPDQGDSKATDPVLRTPSGVAAVVAFFPPTDMRELAETAQDSAAAPAISPVLFASAGDPPTLLVHGDVDQVVEIRHSQRMHAALKQAGVITEFVTITGGRHNFSEPEHNQRGARLMREWFAQHLLKK
jgi:acetyl esterase/lipase